MQPFEQVLELDKVLARAAEFTSNESSRRMMLDTRPSCDLAEVRAEVGKTDDALRLAMQFGTPPFTGFKDICGMVTRAASGARLSLRDLLDVADLLRQVQSLHSWYAHCSGEATSLDYLFSLITPLDGLLTTLERSIVSEEELADAASPTLSEIRRKLVREYVDYPLVEVDLSVVREKADCGRSEALRMGVEHVGLVQRVEGLPAALGYRLAVADDDKAVDAPFLHAVERLFACVDPVQDRLRVDSLRLGGRVLHLGNCRKHCKRAAKRRHNPAKAVEIERSSVFHGANYTTNQPSCGQLAHSIAKNSHPSS